MGGGVDHDPGDGESIKFIILGPGTWYITKTNPYYQSKLKVPSNWTKLAYASLNGLSAWYADLLLRIKELQGWISKFSLPNTVWLPGFFNPQSFLTAIMQSTARKNELPLDKMCLVSEVTSSLTSEGFDSAPKEGAYIHGLFME